MNEVLISAHSAKNYSEIQLWCYDNIGHIVDDWDVELLNGGHGKILKFTFAREQDTTAFILRWIK